MDDQAAAAGLMALIFGGGMMMFLFFFLFIIFPAVCSWKIFAKAGKPGWAAIVPIYNLFVLLEIIGKPLWWIILMLIPLVNIVVSFLVYLALAGKFGKGGGFGVGLVFLPFIFFPILAFDSSTYRP